MRRLSHLITCLLSILIFASHPAAQGQEPRSPSSFSLMLNAGFNGPASKSMRGSRDTFQTEFARSYTALAYPFGDNLATSATWGGQIAYRFAGIPVSLLASLQRTTFSVIDPQTNEVRLALWTISLGGEYSFGTFEDRWNGFGRLGVNTSSIDGSVYGRALDSSQSTTSPAAATVAFTPARRFGFEGELGGRYNIKGLPLSLEAAVNYTNANIGGKSFDRPPAPVRPPSPPPDEVGLNDAPDPLNPSDPGRTIDFVSVRFGVRVRM